MIKKYLKKNLFNLNFYKIFIFYIKKSKDFSTSSFYFIYEDLKFGVFYFIKYKLEELYFIGREKRSLKKIFDYFLTIKGKQKYILFFSHNDIF